MSNRPPSRHSSSLRRQTAAARPTSIATRSSPPCWTTIAPDANGACFRTMFRRCVRFGTISTCGIVMEPSSKSMIRRGNWRDTRWIATRSRPSASWTPNQSQRPKQAASAATMGEQKVNGRTRQCWVDTNGFLVRVLVHPADIAATEGAA